MTKKNRVTRRPTKKVQRRPTAKRVSRAKSTNLPVKGVEASPAGSGTIEIAAFARPAPAAIDPDHLS